MPCPCFRGVVAASLACAIGAGCVTTPSRPEPAPPADPALAAPVPAGREAALATLEEARSLYEEGNYSAALVRCVDLARTDPMLPGLEELRLQVLTASLEKRTIDAARDEEMSQGRMAVEAIEKAAVPDTYGLQRYVAGETGSHLSEAGPLRRALDMPVTIHVQGADLGVFIDALSQDKNVNLIADAGLGAGKTVDIEVDGVPLREILDYLERNFDVRFYLGENIIWATAAENPDTSPMETRRYKLRHGLQFHGSDWRQRGDATNSTLFSEISVLSGKATVLAEEENYLLDLIRRFVPQVEGAQLYMDANTHILLARDTPANLELIEQLIETLDVSPPQVLIEARFVEVLVADLRELGIEWILDSPLIVSKTGVETGEGVVRMPRTQIDEGGSFSTVPFRGNAEGPFPSGAGSSFDLLDDAALENQGLNIVYRGTLTDPMFQAVLHALEISGKGRILSVPRVTTINNNPAKLRNGEDLLYYEEFEAQALQVLDDNRKAFNIFTLVPKGRPTLAELGITLVAVPSVGADMRTINLLLTPTISRLEGFISYQDEQPTNTVDSQQVRPVVAKLPIVSRREVQTKVVVESGETVVMGGLIDTVSQNTEQGIPIISSIPLLGRLFSRTAVTEEQRNLLIFVTATVLSERGESLLGRAPRPAVTPP